MAPTYDELLELTRRQARLVEELRAEVDRLKRELEESRRAAKRQAAPFSKRPPKADPKRPGRKPGHEPSHRPAPPPEQVDRTIEVSLPEGCPQCGASLGSIPPVVHSQYQIDLPVPEPVITRFLVPVAICPVCRAPESRGGTRSRPPTPSARLPCDSGRACWDWRPT
jgi:hypothetical protein